MMLLKKVRQITSPATPNEVGKRRRHISFRFYNYFVLNALNIAVDKTNKRN